MTKRDLFTALFEASEEEKRRMAIAETLTDAFRKILAAEVEDALRGGAEPGDLCDALLSVSAKVLIKGCMDDGGRDYPRSMHGMLDGAADLYQRHCVTAYIDILAEDKAKAMQVW